MTRRVLFYVQHLLGVGHLKRAEALADAMAAAGLEVTVALGGRPLPEVPFAGAAVSQLPPATIAGEDFSALLDGNGDPVDDHWRDARRSALLQLYRRLDPDVLLLELFPFGRRQFRFELIPLLEAAHGHTERPRIATSVRDILVTSKKPGRSEEITDFVRRYFDALLVHGDPTVVPFEATFPAAAAIADLVRYTGYVTAAGPPPAAAEGHGEVLVSAGGGAVGGPLLRAALAARPLTAVKDRVWRLLAGPNLPASLFAEIAAQADRSTIVERYRADFPSLLAAAALSISQAGYNTTLDLLRAGTPAVVVPFESGGETEQRFRAELLAKRGLLTVVSAAELTPQRLAEAIDAALGKTPAGADIDLSGASSAARMIAELAERRPPRTVTAW